jgi:RimJ/RimL family protein N-acetyltransferase
MTVDTLTPRLRLSRPTAADLQTLFAISADPRVWTHYPTLRHVAPEETVTMMARWEEGWEVAGLGPWSVRLRSSGELIGYGGCSLFGGEVWNLGYRLSADHHGNGYATELSFAAVEAVRAVDPDRPVIAFLVEHNRASARVAEKVGLELVYRAPDAGNPDPSVWRLVYADRSLTQAQLAAVSL